MDWQARGVLRDVPDLLDVGDLELRVDTLREQVQGHRDDVDIPRPLAIAEEGPFDAVGPREQTELSGGHASPPVIVGVEADDDRVTVLDGAAEPLDDVGIEVRRVVLDSARQVQDDRPLRRGLDHIHDRLADLNGVVRLGTSEALG